MSTTETREKAKSIQILGRTWRDKVNGNTYHSARVFVDGELVGAVPFQYGYGSQFEWNGVDVLERIGRFTGEEARHVDAERQRLEPGWRWIRDRLKLNYLVDVSECSKRECIAWGEA